MKTARSIAHAKTRDQKIRARVIQSVAGRTARQSGFVVLPATASFNFAGVLQRKAGFSKSK
jgi:hypothetical protein